MESQNYQKQWLQQKINHLKEQIRKLKEIQNLEIKKLQEKEEQKLRKIRIDTQNDAQINQIQLRKLNMVQELNEQDESLYFLKSVEFNKIDLRVTITRQRKQNLQEKLLKRPEPAYSQNQRIQQEELPSKKLKKSKFNHERSSNDYQRSNEPIFRSHIQVQNPVQIKKNCLGNPNDLINHIFPSPQIVVIDQEKKEKIYQQDQENIEQSSRIISVRKGGPLISEQKEIQQKNNLNSKGNLEKWIHWNDKLIENTGLVQNPINLPIGKQALEELPRKQQSGRLNREDDENVICPIYPENMPHHPREYARSMWGTCDGRYVKFKKPIIVGVNIPPNAFYLIHKNKPIDESTFFTYNWLNLVQMNLISCKITDQVFKSLIDHVSLYPNMMILFLSYNYIQTVTEAMLVELSRLKYINFGQELDTRNKSLSNDSVREIKRYKEHNPKKKVLCYQLTISIPEQSQKRKMDIDSD